MTPVESTNASGKYRRRSLLQKLTLRERTILELLIAGQDMHCIAQKLSIERIEFEIAKYILLRKFKVDTTQQLVTVAKEIQLIE